MSNMDIYNKVRVVPKEAQKTITAGRIKGTTGTSGNTVRTSSGSR